MPDPIRTASPSHTGAIVGGVVGGIAFIGVAVLLLLWFRRRSVKQDFDGDFDPDRVSGRPGMLPHVDLGDDAVVEPYQYGSQAPSMRQSTAPLVNQSGNVSPPMSSPSHYSSDLPSVYGNQAAQGGYGNQGPQGGYGNQVAQGGYGNQGPQGGFANQGPQGGFANQGPQGGFANQPPPSGYGNQGPAFGNAPPSAYNQPGFPVGGLVPAGALLRGPGSTATSSSGASSAPPLRPGESMAASWRSAKEREALARYGGRQPGLTVANATDGPSQQQQQVAQVQMPTPQPVGQEQQAYDVAGPSGRPASMVVQHQDGGRVKATEAAEDAEEEATEIPPSYDSIPRGGR